MSDVKAILEIDLPESCGCCKLMKYGEETYYYEVCGAFDEPKNVENYRTDNRAPHCPLKIVAND